MKKQPKVGDWVCAVCGGTDFRSQGFGTVGYLTSAWIGPKGELHSGPLIEEYESQDYKLVSYDCQTCGQRIDPYQNPDRLSDQPVKELLQLKLEGPFPSQWSAHDMEAWVAKQQQQKKKGGKK